MGSDEFFGCILKLFICDFSYNYSLVNILSSLLNVRNVNFYAKFNWWNRCVIWASGDQYSSRIFFYKKFKNASKKFVKSHEREIWILNGIFTKVASPPAVNSPLGSAKMNHVAANSSTLSASSKEPSPAPTPSNLANHNVISFLELYFLVFESLILQNFWPNFRIERRTFFSLLLIFRNVELEKLDYIFQQNFQLSESSMHDKEVFIMCTLENSLNMTNYFLTLRRKNLLSSNFVTL